MTTDPIKTETKTAAIEPVQVVMISGSGTGTGDGGTPIKSGTIAETPGQQPNLVTVVISPLRAIVVRNINLFLTLWVGLVTAGATGIGTTLMPTEFYPMAIACAKIAGVSVCIGIAKDTITIFGRLEQKFPLMTGSV